MNKNQFIKKMDSIMPIFNEINIWGIISDYMEKCSKCNDILYTHKNQYLCASYYITHKPYCLDCVTIILSGD